MPKMKTPQRTVLIYEDPVTRQKLEGEAEVIKLLWAGPDNAERYLVHFLGTPPSEVVERTIVWPSEEQND